MQNEILEIQNNCKKIATSLNIHKYDVYGALKQDNSASAKDGKPFALNASFKNYITLRVWNEKGQVGVASTSNLAESGLKIAFEMAFHSSVYSDVGVHYNFSPLALDDINENNHSHDNHFATIQEISQAVVEGEKYILENLSAVKTIPYNKISQSGLERFYFNSANSFRKELISSAFCYYYPQAQEENRLPRQHGQVVIAKNFKSLDYINCAKKSVEKTQKHLSYAKVQPGKYTVIFAPEAFLDLVSSFSNFFNGQNMLDKKSLLLRESIETQVASSCLNIIDDPLNINNYHSNTFDEEGTPTKSLTIVENGILKNVLQTSFSAEKFNTLPTGHSSIGSKLTASHHFLRIFGSSKARGEEPIISSNKFIYIEEVKALHAGVNATQGSFSLPIDGFLLEDGKKISIEIATVAGDFLTLLKNIIFISEKEIVTPSGICPEVWVKELAIT